MSSNLQFPKICLFCGSDFIAKKSTTQFCSPLCAKYSYKKRKREGLVKENLWKYEEKKSEEVKTITFKDYLSVKDACSLLGIGRTNLYSQLNSGVNRIKGAIQTICGIGKADKRKFKKNRY